MNYKVLVFVLLIPAIILSMEQAEKMTLIKKNWEDAKPFAGHIVAFKIPWGLAETCAYEVEGASPNIRFGKISKDIQRPNSESYAGYSLISLKKIGANPGLVYLRDVLICEANLELHGALALRLVNLKEIEAISEAFSETSKSSAYFKFPIEEDVALLHKEYVRAKCGATT